MKNRDGYNVMELVPDFGDGHSGNTAGAAYAITLGVLRGDIV